MYDQALIDRIRGAVDIAEVIGEHVALKRAGANSLKGLCPFHKEKTPSFHVNTARQIFKCFGCGQGGNAVTFIMRLEGLPFPEALRRLAARAKIELPDSRSPEELERRRLLQAVEAAAELYHRALLAGPAGARARDLLARRKVADATVKAFRLGYCGGGEIFAAKMHPALLAKAGLAVAGHDGSPHDRMRGRLVIPITDETGRVVAFGGRALDPRQEPKYLNTAETPLYRKSNVLFGLATAKDAIREAGAAVLVEGYFDAIALQAAGVGHAVAVLGTSLTDAQLNLLRRFARTLFIVYDEDVGGNEAALRGLDLATEAGFDVRIVRLPGGGDPDEYVLAHGREGFLKLLADAEGPAAEAGGSPAGGAAVSLFGFRLEVACRQADPATLEGQKRIVASLLPFLARVPNAIERHAYVQRLSDRLRVRERDVNEELDRYAARVAASPAPAARTAKVPALPPAALAAAARAEKVLLGGVLRHRASAVNALLGLPDEAFRHPELRRLAARLRELLGAGAAFSVAALMDEVQDAPGLVALLAEAEAEGGEPVSEDACRDAAALLERALRKDRIREVQRRIEHASDPDDVAKLMEEKQRLVATNS